MSGYDKLGIGVGLLLCFLGFIDFALSVPSHESNGNETIARELSSHHLEVPESELFLLYRNKLRKWGSKKHSREETEALSKPKQKLCFCEAGICTCCTGFLLGLIGQKACLQVRYSPEEFSFDVSMTLNDNVLYENRLSGKNPQPACFSLPGLDSLKICAKFSNVFFPGRNFHFCANMVGQWGQVPLFDIAFDCLRMGAQGVAMVKPEESGGLTVAGPGGGVDAIVDSGDDDIEDYDENMVKSLFDIFER